MSREIAKTVSKLSSVSDDVWLLHFSNLLVNADSLWNTKISYIFQDSPVTDITESYCLDLHLPTDFVRESTWLVNTKKYLNQS